MSDILKQNNPGWRQTEIALTGRYLIAFAALTILCGTSHEFAHHFTGAAMCGAFGTKTFNSFELAPGCGLTAEVVATCAGPIFTFGLMWWGVALLRREDLLERRLGLAIIFANFPINRLFFVLIQSNDEDYVRRLLFPDSVVAHWITVALVWLIAVPPLVFAYRALANKPRWLWFMGLFILPFVFVIVFAGLFLEQYLLLDHRILASPVLGVPWLIIVVEMASLALYVTFRRSF